METGGTLTERNLNMIVAMDVNRVIGYHGGIPWQGKIPSDIRHFRKTTLGKTVFLRDAILF